MRKFFVLTCQFLIVYEKTQYIHLLNLKLHGKKSISFVLHNNYYIQKKFVCSVVCQTHVLV